MKDFKELIDLVKTKSKKAVAVAACEDKEVLEAVISASQMDIAHFILFGDVKKTSEIIKENNLELPNTIELIFTKSTEESAREAVKYVSSGRADVLMKGLIDTNIILKEVLNKEYGLRTSSILSHVMMLELPKLKRIIFLTDGAMNIDPSVDQLEDIVNNAVNLTKSLNYSSPKVAIISAVEKVNPKMPSTLKAKEVADLFANKDGVVLEGPLALDLAIDRDAAITKGIKGEIKGDADILVVPFIEVANALYKGWVFGSENVKNAGVIIGAKCPIVLTSRADTHEAKVYSIALSLMMWGK